MRKRICDKCGGAFLPRGMSKHRPACKGKAPAVGVPHYKQKWHCPKCGEWFAGNGGYSNHIRSCRGTGALNARKPTEAFREADAYIKGAVREVVPPSVRAPLLNGNTDARLARLEKVVEGILTGHLKSLQVLVDELNKHRDAF